MGVNKARTVQSQNLHEKDIKHKCYCKMAMNYKKFADRQWAHLIGYINAGDYKGFKREFRIWEAKQG